MGFKRWPLTPKKTTLRTSHVTGDLAPWTGYRKKIVRNATGSICSSRNAPIRKANSIDKITDRSIKLVRLMKGLSQTELGEGIGVTYQQIQKYERGSDRISARPVRR
jgi:DNA-binding XRE family transcriptional regulator